jgi:hypothetical protein
MNAYVLPQKRSVLITRSGQFDAHGVHAVSNRDSNDLRLSF